jgi:hydroxyacylglutathione hydrolase
MKVELLPALADNYVAVVTWDDGCFVVDPGDAQVVLDWMSRHHMAPQAILNTHHHADHVAGNALLVQKFGCPVIGPNEKRIPHLSTTVTDGVPFSIGPVSLLPIATPGHTRTHTAYYAATLGWLFSGDCLFGGGCGRCFEGTGQQMWDSLHKLLALPDPTLIYCGHEYTVDNLEYGQQVEPHNRAIHMRLLDAKRKIASGQPTLPTTVELEKQTNVWARNQKLLMEG